MRTLIVYGTKYGAARVCAERIANELGREADVVNLADGGDLDLDAYDLVVVGTSIYMGRPRKEVRAFCRARLETLLKKRVGLFLCCVQDGEPHLGGQFAAAFPAPLLGHAAARAQLGGVVDFTKLSRLDRFIMTKVAGDLRARGDVVSTLSDERIAMFCQMLAKTPE